MQREEKETAQALYKSDPNDCELSKKTSKEQQQQQHGLGNS